MKVMYYLRKMSEYKLMVRNFKNRGGLHDTLIRREAVENIKIPKDLHVYEDWYVKKYVEDKGYLAIAPEDLWCLHYLNPSYTLRNLTIIAKLQRKYGLQSGFITLRNLMLAPAKCIAILALTGDWKSCRDQWNMYFYNFIGRFLL